MLLPPTSQGSRTSMTTIEEGLPSRDLFPERVYTLPELRYPDGLNVARELLDRNADGGRAGRPAVFAGEQVLTYGELQKKVNRLGNGLRALGLDRGSRVLLRMPNVPEFVITWLACQKLGIITVGTMPMLRSRELAYIVNEAETTAAVVWGGIREELEKAQREAPTLKRLIVAGEPKPGDVGWQDLLAGQPERLAAEDTGANDVAMIAYTSGSTGVPKGCVHFHNDILASADSYARYVLTPSEEDRFGGHPTLAFTFGTGGLMVFPFRFGGWNVTGDVYIKAPDGYFSYQCRSDDMIVSGGYKIPGPEVERVLDEHPAVAESAVVASPDETRGYVVKAYIVLKPGQAASEAFAAQLQEHVKKELAPYKYPRRIEFVERLPRTETGKIRRVDLRRQEAERARGRGP